MNAPDCICSPGRLPLGAFCAGRDDLEREALHDDRISIRAPRAGCDQAAATKKGFMSEFQSTRPVWGATRSPMWRSCSSRYFNPRAPCGARLGPALSLSPSLLISIHAPRVGRDRRDLESEQWWRAISIHAPRVGRDQEIIDGWRQQFISIHAPRVGRDVFTLNRRKKMHKISIHAPRVGRDRWRSTFRPMWNYFNPRAPCGARRHPPALSIKNAVFQSTRPVWGATCGSILINHGADISIHAPRVGRDLGAADIGTTDTTFQSTRPVWGATTPSLKTLPTMRFQSTRPVWGATLMVSINSFITAFQSTRPVWGATRKSPEAHGRPRKFQSTRPVWGATTFAPVVVSVTIFQSTRPVWGATSFLLSWYLRRIISIHAPRVGRDVDKVRGYPIHAYFNPRAPCGARPIDDGDSHRLRWISIHAPRVGRDAPGAVIVRVASNISIHAPRVGRDHVPRFCGAVPRAFQSTRPVWGATL